MQVFITEWLKLKRSKVIPLLIAGPLVVWLQGLTFRPPDLPDVSHWNVLFGGSIIMYAMLFFPLLTGILSAFICRFEHAQGGWKQLLSYPVSRTKLYFSKLSVILILLGMTQLLMIAAVLLVGWIKGIDGPIPWTEWLRSCAAGWIAAWPLAALQLWISIIWQSFGGALSVNVIFALPAILAANSETFGPFYPWALPLLAMASESGGEYFNIPMKTILTVVAGGFLISTIAGWLTLVKRDIKA